MGTAVGLGMSLQYENSHNAQIQVLFDETQLSGRYKCGVLRALAGMAGQRKSRLANGFLQG